MSVASCMYSKSFPVHTSSIKRYRKVLKVVLDLIGLHIERSAICTLHFLNVHGLPTILL